MSKGTLRALLKDPHYKMSFTSQTRAALDIARGMKYLHNRQFLHRDPKSDNCLVNDLDRVKVADFGTSRKLEKQIFLGEAGLTTCQVGDPNDGFGTYIDIDGEPEAANLTKGIGTLLWMAPEIMEGSAKYGQPADVYSFAIVLWEILSRSLPWEDITSY